MKIRWLLVSIALLGLTFLSGCWSNQELPDLALVSAIGIDQAEDGAYTTTVQVINPGNVAGDGMQGTGGSESPPVSTYTATGYNLTEINRKMSKKVSRQLYYAHTNLLVLSEKLVKEEGIKQIFDVLERDHEFRTSAKVVIAYKSDAEDVIKTLASIDKIPANKIINTLESTERSWGEHLSIDTRELVGKLASSSQDPVITCFRTLNEKGESLQSIQKTDPEGRLSAAGLAVFKDGKMIDISTGRTSKGIMWVLNKIQSTSVSIDWKNEKKAVAFDVVRQRTNVSADVQKGQDITINVKVSTEGSINEVKIPIALSDPHVLHDLEKGLEKEIKSNIESSVKRAQELETDILGFGEAVHRAAPQEWKKWGKDWNEEFFPDVRVNVSVDAFIRRTGLRNEPFHLNETR